MPFNGSRTILGTFLVGAYQEILGDLHNLFGDTNAVHVRLGETGEVILNTVVRGDTVREVLDYVQFNATALLGAVPRGRGERAAGGQDRLRGIRAAAAVLRGRAERVHVPGTVGVEDAGFRVGGTTRAVNT